MGVDGPRGRLSRSGSVHVTQGTLLQQRSNTEFETSFYRSAERIDPSEPFSNVKDEYILRGVLKLWGARSTGEILDYVYFQTAPMEAGIRNARLDFSVIQPERPTEYSRSSSGKSKAEIQKLRTKFEAEQAQRRSSLNQPFAFTPPKYDEEYLNAMLKPRRPQCLSTSGLARPITKSSRSAITMRQTFVRSDRLDSRLLPARKSGVVARGFSIPVLRKKFVRCEIALR
jgi:hypothetical protein